MPVEKCRFLPDKPFDYCDNFAKQIRTKYGVQMRVIISDSHVQPLKKELLERFCCGIFTG